MIREKSTKKDYSTLSFKVTPDILAKLHIIKMIKGENTSDLMSRLLRDYISTYDDDIAEFMKYQLSSTRG